MTSWNETFRRRMQAFELHRPPAADEISVSVKIRVVGGCFHREHSPHAYELIDEHLAKHTDADAEFSFKEHESGPEILVYLGLATAGLGFATGVINLIVAILNARSAGVRKGDQPSEPVEVIIRRVEKDGECREEKVMRFGHRDPIDRKQIEQKLNNAAKKLTEDVVEETSSQRQESDDGE